MSRSTQPRGERGAVVDSALVDRKAAGPKIAATLEAVATKLRAIPDADKLAEVLADLRRITDDIADLIEPGNTAADVAELVSDAAEMIADIKPAKPKIRKSAPAN